MIVAIVLFVVIGVLITGIIFIVCHDQKLRDNKTNNNIIKSNESTKKNSTQNKSKKNGKNKKSEDMIKGKDNNINKKLVKTSTNVESKINSKIKEIGTGSMIESKIKNRSSLIKNEHPGFGKVQDSDTRTKKNQKKKSCSNKDAVIETFSSTASTSLASTKG